MSASAVISPNLASLEFWKRFCAELKRRIGEGNALSGEKLWETSTCTGSAGISIQNVYRPTDRITCIFDLPSRVLFCQSGSRTAFDRCTFQWTGGTADTLRKGSEEMTLSDALTLLLDNLVWPEE